MADIAMPIIHIILLQTTDKHESYKIATKFPIVPDSVYILVPVPRVSVNYDSTHIV